MKNQARILILGQSNAANHGPVRANGGPHCRVFHQGSFLPAVDPLPGASGGGGSVWTRFAPKLIARQGVDEVILVNLSHGGTAMADWAPGGKHHTRVPAVLDAAKAAGIEFTHVVWHQGERDTLMMTGEAAYRAALDGLIGFLRDRGIDAPVFVCRASYHLGRTSSAVRQAQQGIVDQDRNIFAGPDTDALGAELRHDDFHLDARGQDLFADMLVDSFAAASPAMKASAAG